MATESSKAAVVRLMFDRERKLVARHKYLRDAVRQSGQSITQLMNDPFGGYPYLLMALLEMDRKDNERALTLDRASELIDIFTEKNGSIVPLTQGLVRCVQSYLGIESRPTEGEDPNETSPGATGPDVG